MQILKHKRIGALLRKFRLRRGLTQCEVAHALRVSKQFISSMERGKQAIPRAKRDKVAAVLGIEAEKML